ncbi:MAG: hypothetical protein IKM86_05965, partial [Acidaminococcaceae bacterium]|nr:hypothetical protein [Acidaminococcaceae bacterium]
QKADSALLVVQKFLTSLGLSQKGLTRTFIWFVIQFSRFLAVFRRLDYNSTSIFLCQYLFSKKSKVFQVHCLKKTLITAKAWKNAEKRGLRLSLNAETRNLFRFSLRLH